MMDRRRLFGLLGGAAAAAALPAPAAVPAFRTGYARVRYTTIGEMGPELVEFGPARIVSRHNWANATPEKIRADIQAMVDALRLERQQVDPATIEA